LLETLLERLNSKDLLRSAPLSTLPETVSPKQVICLFNQVAFIFFAYPLNKARNQKSVCIFLFFLQAIYYYLQVDNGDQKPKEYSQTQTDMLKEYLLHV